MLVGGWDGKGPTRGMGAGKPVSLVEGATGAYNDYYKMLATKLVEQGLGNSIIRLGQEFNGGWYTWRASVNPQAYAAYWRQIVTTMRSVPGTEKLEFCWNPAMGWQQFPADQAWPETDKDGKYLGNYVDYVGLDLYDDSWMANTYPWPEGTSDADIAARQNTVWKSVLLDGQFGLNFWKKFASDHKKKFALPEWGVSQRSDKHGGLDNPQFIENMYKFITDPANDVAFHVYFDVWAPDGNHQLSPGESWDSVTKFPKSAAKFRELFGGPVVPAKLPLRINAGGKDAAPFIADTGYSEGDTGSTKATITVTAEHAAPIAVYQTSRYGKITYAVANLHADTSYTVRLHFCESYYGLNGHGGKGSRIFNVAINGTPALTDFDIFAEAGGTNIAVVEDVTAKADSTGLLRITLTPATSTVDKNPTINGIEVLQ
jgi:hypothetical protein